MTYRTVEEHAAATGYSVNAIYSKTNRGIWPEGVVWVKEPNGRVMISEEGYKAWVEGKIT